MTAFIFAGALCAEDFEREAEATLEPGVRAYVAGGASAEITLRANLDVFRNVRVRPRVMTGVGEVDPTATLLGLRVASPIGLCPVGANGLVHPDAELAVARAAKDAQVLHVVSTLSTRSMEEVAEVGGPRWFQVYRHRDDGVTRALLDRAAAAGYRALVLTADMPVVGRREREQRAGFAFDRECHGNFQSGDVDALMDGLQNASLAWSDIEWIRTRCDLPVVVKGILRGDDAARAVEHGAAAVLVSNHGARQLDRSPATLDVLPEVIEAVAGRAEVYLDGGIRRGLDALVAIALGARAVFVGRPYVAALAVGGQDGVARLLQLLRDEVIEAMTLLGTRTLADVDRAALAPTWSPG